MYSDCDRPLGNTRPTSEPRIGLVRKVEAAIASGRFEDYAALSRSGTRTPEQMHAQFKWATEVSQRERPTHIVSRYDVGSVSHFGIAAQPNSAKRLGSTVVQERERLAYAPELITNGVLQNIAALDRARAESPQTFSPATTIAFSAEQKLLPKALMTSPQGAAPSVTVRYTLVKCDIDLLQVSEADLSLFGAAAPVLQFYRRAYVELKRGDPRAFVDSFSPTERPDVQEWVTQIQNGPGGIEDFRRTILTQKRIRAVIDAGAAWIIVTQVGRGPYGGPLGDEIPQYESVRWNQGRGRFEIVNRVNTANMEYLLRDPDFQAGLSRQVAFDVHE